MRVRKDRSFMPILVGGFVLAACESTPRNVPASYRTAPRIAAAETTEAKKEQANAAVVAAKADAANLQSAAARLEQAIAAGDPRAIEVAAQDYDEAKFGTLLRIDEAQDPAPKPPDLTDVLRGKTTTEIEKAFPGVSMAAFEQAFGRQAEAKQTTEAKKLSLEGFNFGVGIGATFDMHSGSRVEGASIRDGVVRVDDEDDTQLGLVLETHYFWVPGTKKLVGHGPFVAIKTGENDVIDEAGIGWMIGLRKQETDTNSFNIGLGVMVDPNATVLADGFSENQAPPAGATDVALKKEERFSFAIVFSYTF